MNQIIREDIEETQEGFLSSVYNKEDNSLLVSFVKKEKDNDKNLYGSVICLTKFSFPNIE